MTQADSDGLPHLAGIVLFMHQTAARVSEAVNLLGEHVDLDKHIVLLAKTKTDEWAGRHLTKELTARISMLNPKAGERVFRYTAPQAVNRRIKAVCERAGLDVRTTHSVGRHLFGTKLTQA